MVIQTEEQRKAALQAAGLTPEQQTAVTGGIPITSADLSSNAKPIEVSPAPSPIVPDITGGTASIADLNKLFAQASPGTTDLTSIFFGTSPKPQAPAYEEALKGLEPQQQDVLTKQGAAQTARNKLATINAQLAGISAEAQAAPIQTQQDITGRGVTKAASAVMDAEALRKIALRAIPLQVQAFVAQAEVAAAQGDMELSQNVLKMAQDKLNTIFQLKVKDEENTYNYWKDLRDKVWDQATAQQKNTLATQQKKDDRDFQIYQDQINNLQTISNNLMQSGQGELAGKISQLDPKSKTFQADLATLQAQAKPKEGGGDIADFKSFFPNVDITTPAGQQQFLNWQARVGEAGRVPVVSTPGAYIPGSNPTVDNWARLIISGKAKITEVPNPRGSTLRSEVVNAINSSGQLLLSDKDREKLSTLDTAFNVYETIKGLSEKINTFGVGGRVTGYLSRYIGGVTQYNVDIARYNATRQGFVSNVARTLGEKGTLAEGDVQRAINNLPKVNDTKAVAEGKLETLRTILRGAKDSIIQKSTEPLTGTTSGTLPVTGENLRDKYNY